MKFINFLQLEDGSQWEKQGSQFETAQSKEIHILTWLSLIKVEIYAT